MDEEIKTVFLPHAKKYAEQCPQLEKQVVDRQRQLSETKQEGRDLKAQREDARLKLRDLDAQCEDQWQKERDQEAQYQNDIERLEHARAMKAEYERLTKGNPADDGPRSEGEHDNAISMLTSEEELGTGERAISPNFINSEQTESTLSPSTAISSRPNADSPTDSEVTFGAPETPDKALNSKSTTPSKVSYEDLQEASQLHDAYPTVFRSPNGECFEYWCEVCGANVGVDAGGNSSIFPDGTMGLYNHTVQEHLDGIDAVDSAEATKKLKRRRIGKKDQDLILQGKQPNMPIVMRVPWSNERASIDTQPEMRTREVGQGGEEVLAFNDLETPLSKRRCTARNTAIIGNQKREADLEINPYLNGNNRPTKKKNKSAKKPSASEQANKSVSNKEQSNTKQAKITAIPEHAQSPEPATPTPQQTPLTLFNRSGGQGSSPKPNIRQHKGFPDRVMAQFSPPSDEQDDDEDLPAGTVSE